MSNVKPVPSGFGTITPMLVIKDARAAIDFYQKAFGAEVLMRLNGPHDMVAHAELKIGDSVLMIADEWPGHHVQSPGTVQGTTNAVHLYVADVDAAHRKAVAAGAREVKAPVDMFWGDRHSAVVDPYGHAWSLATHVKDVTQEECQKACDEWMAQMARGEGGA